MSQQRGLARDHPYDGRDSLDPGLLRIAASGLVPLAFVAHRLGIDGTELLARHGYLLIEERDRLQAASFSDGSSTIRAPIPSRS